MTLDFGSEKSFHEIALVRTFALNVRTLLNKSIIIASLLISIIFST